MSNTKEDIKCLTDAQLNCEIAGAIFKRKEQIDVYKRDTDNNKIKDEKGKYIIENKELLTPEMLGFIADGLPDVAFSLEYDKEADVWVRNKECVYTSAVIGILCERVKTLEKENGKIKELVQDLLKRLDKLKE
jgi:hypothetical protein